MTPSGRKKISRIRMIPKINVQYSVYLPTNVLSATVMAAPNMGPAKVNHPPRRHMMRTSRDKTQKSISGNTDRSNTTKRTPAIPAKKVAITMA